jgi:hypothetical protein
LAQYIQKEQFYVQICEKIAYEVSSVCDFMI